MSTLRPSNPVVQPHDKTKKRVEIGVEAGYPFSRQF